ncbi:membrane protein [Carbonactinospora thermoautotrophica]|uniref:Membrane protein n=1 Tax=Carbonactinospora thermoautotrophica TaxID=1469144 RepID=A0A132N4U7_9ACTN|nr:hypothetical protein [Carbonactinospora thermoautotrophica]KWX04980.1 membrane protein [Carbonactinospora thermoautotrophica]KWX06498.1 membrane protein [Carbonactinospora thermoautotrophica]
MATETPAIGRFATRTLRTDRWWVAPLTTVLVLLAFIIYSTWRAFENQYYYSTPYLSPMYSPCLATGCVPGSSDFGTPIGDWWKLSPALLVLIFPLGFRLTCYYYRKAYYRSFWMSPPACAVGEPHRKYTGETRFPLILQNVHRYFFYVALLFVVILTYDAVLAFRDENGNWGHMGVGTLVLLVNVVLLGLYTVSCHSCRHVVGGRLKHFSRRPIRYRLWTWVSKLNARHMALAWLSLFSVALADLYVRLVASGAVTDPRFF